MQVHIRAGLAALVVLGLTSAAHAQTPAPGATITVNVDNVRSASGRVIATLCSEAPTVYCSTYIARAPAAVGKTQLRITGVAPGRYALSSVHDENGNGRPEIPPEGLGLGNDASAPTFDATAIQVKGDATLAVRMTYPGSINAGSKGVAPPKGTIRADVRENGLYAEFYAPQPVKGAKPLPAVILIDGSAPGLDGVSVLASQFASNGVAALALAYWGEQGLPPTLENIPLEYFDKALAALKARPDIDPDRIGVLGISRGSEAAFMLAARNPSIRAVAAAGPSSVFWSGYNPGDPRKSGHGWTIAGQPLPYLSPDLMLYDPNAMPRMYSGALAKAGDTSPATIPVERINGPILMMSGQEDDVWPSADMAHRIEAQLQKAGFTHDVETIVYGGLSHSILGASPTAIPRTLDFFKRALAK